MKLRMIASDLDGTLLTDKKEILESTEETLAGAAVQGIHFVPATGRAFHSIPEEVLRLPGVEYVITSNGAAVYSMKTGKRIYERLLEPESVEQILELPINRAGESRMWDDTVPVAFEAFIDGIPYASADNDIDMLRAVRYGIAMENATESCKGAAYAVTGSNREDGVGQMIRKQMEDRVD